MKTEKKAPRESLVVKRPDLGPRFREENIERELRLYLETAPADQQKVMLDERARDAVLERLEELDSLAPVLDRMSSVATSKAERLGVSEFDSFKEGWLKDRIASACELVTLERKNQLLRIENRDLREKVRIDPLTEIANRRGYDEEVARAVELSRRTSVPVWLVMMDIDDFRFVNNKFGHHVGDQVLKEVGRRLSDQTRLSDFVARFGGEEFIAIINGADERGVHAATSRIHAAISDQPFYAHTEKGTKKLKITMSIGASCLQVEEDTSEDVERRADKYLYEVKKKGKNQVCIDGRFPNEFEVVEGLDLDEDEQRISQTA
jgi:diguanylate cyclase (GGDEF)-like protein